MDMTGEYRIPASQKEVWDALNDPEVLKKSIPNCESIERTSDTEMQAVVNAKVGPLKARFAGKVTLSNIVPPVSYTLSGEGQGAGGVGFAKGGVDVSLKEDGPTATILSYKVSAQVGGKLAQIGSRLIDSVAQQQAKQFFTNFTQHFEAIAASRPAPAPAPAAAPPPPPQPAPVVSAPAAPVPVAPPLATPSPAPASPPAAAPASSGEFGYLAGPTALFVVMLVILYLVHGR